MKRMMILTICVLITALGFAGTTGRVSGRITDLKTSLPIHAANVLIMGTSYGAATDKDGLYLIKDVPPGKYVINALAKGYSLNKMQDIAIKVDRTTTVNFSLQSSIDVDNASGMASISGIVLDEKTKMPIAGVRIIIGGDGTETDSKGQFGISSNFPSVISAKVVADGYTTKYYHDLVINPDKKNMYQFSLLPIERLTVKTFNFNYISGKVAASMVEGLMSREGKLVAGGDNTISILDTEACLNQIQKKLEEIDLPPKQIWLEVQLILASPRANGQDLPDELSHIKKQLTSLFKYKDYYLLDDARIMAYQNQPCSFVVGQGGYRVQIKKVEYHDIQKGLIKLQHFDLKSEELNQYVLNTSVNIQNGNTVILGASNVDASGQALITVVTAKTVEHHDGFIKTRLDR